MALLPRTPQASSSPTVVGNAQQATPMAGAAGCGFRPRGGRSALKRLRNHNVQKTHMLPTLRTAVQTHAITLDNSSDGVANVLRVPLGHQRVRTFTWVVKAAAITELVERVGQSG
eukprot:472937-Lingulodinium_polyedra.AAC.1